MGRIGQAFVAGTVGLVLGASGVGVAGAATGAAFMLGQSNRETVTATLRSDQGPPLSLRAAKGQPPLAVNSTAVVRRLDAALVGGMPASALQRSVRGRCGAGIAAVRASGSLSCAVTDVVITTSQTWTVPDGIHALSVQAVGGGGGGAVGPNRAGGGGAGATVTKLIRVVPGERLDLVIGRGGTGGSADRPAGGGTATVVYQQSRSGAMLVAAGGGHPGRPGRDAAACEHGSGGVPRLTKAGTAVAAAAGQDGSCLSGGGASGWPGSGGAPAHSGATGGAGSRGSLLLTVAG